MPVSYRSQSIDLLICCASQLGGFDMRTTLVFTGINADLQKYKDHLKGITQVGAICPINQINTLITRERGASDF